MNGPVPTTRRPWDFIKLSNANEDESEGNKPDCPRLPKSFHTPHLRQLDLSRVGDDAKVGLPLLTFLASLVYLAFVDIPASRYLASCFSLIPQLKYIGLVFEFCIP